MRVVSLCPSNTDIVCALGLEHLLVGVDRWSLGDAEAAARVTAGAGPVADVGTDLRANIDAIVALRPDVVLASLSVPGMERNVAALDEHNLPYVVVDGHTIAGVRRGILQVAEALHALEAGRALVGRFDAEIDAVRAEAAAARSGAGSWGRHEPAHAETGTGDVEALPTRAVWEWWPNPVIVAGGRSWIQEFFEILGVENVFADVDKESTPVETHRVPPRAPDTVCVCWCGTLEPRMTVQKIIQRPGWADLPAVRARRVFLLPEKLFGRPGPHLATGLRELYELFYGRRDAAARRLAARARLAHDALVY